MSTGASRLMRSVSPYTNSSATRSPTVTMRAREKRPRRCARSVFIARFLSHFAPPRKGPRLPAPVDPEPVVGVLPDLLLQGARHLLREIHDRCVAGQRGGERPPDSDQVPAIRLPDGESPDQRSSAPEGEHRRGGSGAGFLPEEVDEDPAGRTHVLIDRDGERLAAAQHCQRVARRSALVELADAPARSILQQPAPERIAQLADDHRKLDAAPDADPREQLEIAEVRDGGDEAPALSDPAFQDFPAFGPDVCQVFVAEPQHDLGEAPPELQVARAADLLPLRIGEVG